MTVPHHSTCAILMAGHFPGEPGLASSSVFMLHLLQNRTSEDNRYSLLPAGRLFSAGTLSSILRQNVDNNSTIKYTHVVGKNLQILNQYQANCNCHTSTEWLFKVCSHAHWRTVTSQKHHKMWLLRNYYIDWGWIVSLPIIFSNL